MKLRNLFLPIFSCFLVININGCTSSEIGQSKDVAQETIYQQYDISYNEGEEKATICARFRFAGDKGTTLVVSKPGYVQFDGVDLAVDSSEYEGAFYKKNITCNNFFGDHQFSYADINKRKYDNRFSFDLFKLINVPETAVKNQPLRIQFKPLQLGPDDYIEIGAIETDSSFSVTYSRKDTSQFLVIPAKELQRQKGGQLKMAATLYKKSPLQQNTGEGGILEMIYALKPVSIRLQQ